MKFIKATPNENLNVWRSVSTEGKWEMGFVTMGFGNSRFRFGPNNCGWCTLDLCCGTDPVLQKKMIMWVAVLMTKYEEDVRERQIQDEFPVPSACKPNTDVRLQKIIELAVMQDLEKLAAAVRPTSVPAMHPL